MRRNPLLIVATVAVALAMFAGPALAIGFERVTIPDPGDQALEIGIWYPSDAAASPQPLALFTQTVAPNGPVAGTFLPLILMSHGSGGGFESQYDTALALARAGFVVASVTHSHDNYRDGSNFTHVVDRPRHVVRMLDYMLAQWPAHDRLDPARIGMFGFSAGAFTALVLAGGVPDLTRARAHCQAHPDDWACRQVRERHLPALTDPAPSEWLHDRRIRAAVVAAPAIGMSFTPAGLANVTIPIQLWRGEADHILPHPFYVQAVYDALPKKPEYHVAPKADHFSFLAPCTPQLAEYAAAICEDPPGFDRVAFHEEFNAAVAAFFMAQLRPN